MKYEVAWKISESQVPYHDVINFKTLPYDSWFSGIDRRLILFRNIMLYDVDYFLCLENYLVSL